MAQVDPVPPHLQRAALAWERYKRMMRWMVLAAIVAALLALLYLWLDGGPLPLHMMIATFAGVSLTVLVGTGLMGLVFLSSSSGHDEGAHDAATQRKHEDDRA
jgi:hypothetical protein